MTDRPETTVEPGRTALLALDYQNGIVDRFPGGDELLERAAGAIATVRRHGASVAFVRVAFTDADYEHVSPTSHMAGRLAGSGTAYHADSPTTAIHERLAPEPGDIVVRKSRVGAFSTTNLDGQLRARGVDTLLLAGLSTSGAVLSTARDASDRDYRTVVVADACADPDPEIHRFLIERIFPRQAEVVTIAQLDGMLSGVPPSTA